MTTNFDFLKNIDKNLYEIIVDAEKLYRDEYFEQSMTQTRRFAENVCKNVLGDNLTCEKTFDDMLATLKDKSTGSEEEKEFLEDLYFIKKQGNFSTHSSSVNKDAMVALECLQRAFEVAINYSVFYKNSSKNILDLHYDIELLATGKPEENLAEKYQKAKAQTLTKTPSKTTPVKKNKIKKSRNLYSKQTVMKPTYKKQKFSLFWIFVSICASVSICLILFISLAVK